MEVFRKFFSKRWSFERWRRAILLQEPDKSFFTSVNRGFAVSGAQNIHKNSIFVRKDATSELDFEAENLHFHYKMWPNSNETALKQRKKNIFEPLREEPQSPKSGEAEEKYGLSSLIRLQFSCETRLNLPCFFQRENCSPKIPT